MACSSESRSMIPKSWMTWMGDLEPRATSCETSSYWRSSIRPLSLMSSISGLETGSDIYHYPLFCLFRGGVHRLGEFEFLELLLDGHRVLRLGDDLFARNQPRHVFLHQKAV